MTTALLLVDVQRDMLEPPKPVPAHATVKRSLESLLARARMEGALVVHVQNDGQPGEPDEPHTDGWGLVFTVAPDELLIRKTESDAFTNPKLGESLDTKHVNRVVVGGLQSNYCVSATCRGALRHGLEVTLASGAHATYDEKESASRISNRVEEELTREGVNVINAGAIQFR